MRANSGDHEAAREVLYEIATDLLVNRLRQLRAAKHQLAKDGKAQLSVEQLRGWDAYIEMINRS